MIVKQEIPDGDFCAEIDFVQCASDARCIFLDRGDFRSQAKANAFVCRRHPNVTLATEELELKSGKQCIIKCRDCMKDAT